MPGFDVVGIFSACGNRRVEHANASALIIKVGLERHRHAPFSLQIDQYVLVAIESLATFAHPVDDAKSVVLSLAYSLPPYNTSSVKRYCFGARPQ